MSLATLQVEEIVDTTVDSCLSETHVRKYHQGWLTLTVGCGGARTGGSSPWKSLASFSAAFSLQDIWALAPSKQDPQGCLGPGWLCAMCRFKLPALEASVRQRVQRRTGVAGPNVGRGGGRSRGRGRSKGRGRDIFVGLVAQKIVWIELAGFVKWLLRHSIDLVHNSSTPDCFQIRTVV